MPRAAGSTATAPLAPRSKALAATLRGGLRPGSLRVHAPCKKAGHGSRLGFPGRRPPRGPAASAHGARGLQALLPEGDPGQRVAEAGRPAARRRNAPPPALLPYDLMVREFSEDGWGGRRQDPLILF